MPHRHAAPARALTPLLAAACAAIPLNLTLADTPAAGEDLIELHNEHIRVGISPNTGRILHFGPTDGENLLWLNEDAIGQPLVDDHAAADDVRDNYQNVGGDKVWPALQMMWGRIFGGDGGWPPDGVIDGQPWQLIEHDHQRLVMQSRVNTALGAQLQREIRLHDDQPQLTIHNTLTRVQPSIYPVHIWSVTQVRHPQFALLDVAPQRAYPEPWFGFGQPDDIAEQVNLLHNDTTLRWQFETDRGRKVGTFGQWIAGVWDDWVFLQHTNDYDPTAAYPDTSNVQAYADGNYLELELLSPFVHLQPDQSLTNTTTWRLIPRNNRSPEQLRHAIQSHLPGPHHPDE